MWFKLTVFAFLLSFAFASANNAKKVVCYHGSWSTYRTGNGNFKIEDIDPTLCTHLVYTFVGINTDASIRILDPYNDIDNGGFRRFNALKARNPNLKTLVAIGGWKEGSITFSQISGTQYLRSVFIQNAVNFVRTHGFDGFDLDWEYPGQRGGSPLDKVNFGHLVKEFRPVFNQHGYLLTAAVGASATAIMLSYDVPTLSENLDFINIMAYDIHTAYEAVTGQNAPLYPTSNELTPTAQELNVAACIQAWIGNGAAPEKLIMGVGVYGRSFTLANAGSTHIGAPAAGPGSQGPYTLEEGMLGYNEICEKQLGGQWTIMWSDEQKVPYAYSGNQWVGYDNPRSVAIKVDFAKKLKLGGMMIWSIETDDFRGICGPKYPILSTINSNLSFQVLHWYGQISVLGQTIKVT